MEVDDIQCVVYKAAVFSLPDAGVNMKEDCTPSCLNGTLRKSPSVLYMSPYDKSPSIIAKKLLPGIMSRISSPYQCA